MFCVKPRFSAVIAISVLEDCTGQLLKSFSWILASCCFMGLCTPDKKAAVAEKNIYLIFRHHRGTFFFSYHHRRSVVEQVGVKAVRRQFGLSGKKKLPCSFTYLVCSSLIHQCPYRHNVKTGWHKNDKRTQVRFRRWLLLHEQNGFHVCLTFYGFPKSLKIVSFFLA